MKFLVHNVIILVIIMPNTSTVQLNDVDTAIALDKNLN